MISEPCHKVPQHRVAVCGSGFLLVPGLPVLRERVPANWLRRGFYSLLATLDLIRKRTLERGGDEFWTVGRDALAKIVGAEDARHVLKILRHAGFIEPDGKYIPGVRCQGWRLTAFAAGLPVESVELPSQLQERLAARGAERLAFALNYHPAHRNVWRALHRVSLHPDHRECGPADCEDADTYARRLGHWRHSVRLIEEKSWLFCCDKTAGRLHHNVSGLPRELRGYLLLDGEPCAETDIACCQPLLMHRLYPAGSTEAARFAELVSGGKFYEALAEASGEKWGDRQELKRRIYAQVLYDRVRPEALLWQAFVRLFPELAATIAALKEGGHWKLAVANQKAEADIVVRTVIPRLAKELPGVPVLTVHDSLVIPERHAEHGAQVLREEVSRAVGVTPFVTLKPSRIHAQEAAYA